MTVTFRDLLNGHVINDVPINTQHKMEVLQARLNKLEALYGKSFVLTSGWRTEEDQRRINPKAMNSKHLSGQAADVSDVTGELKEWVKNNVNKLEACELWCEDFKHTPTWVHFQIVPPPSGKRFFVP